MSSAFDGNQEPFWWPPKKARRGVRRHCKARGHDWQTQLDERSKRVAACVRCGERLKEGR